MIALAQMEDDPQRALDYVMEGRKAARAAGQSCAVWDLMEFGMRVARMEPNEARRLLEHLQRQHSTEPGVPETIARMLLEMGIIGPDGRPAMPASALPSLNRPSSSLATTSPSRGSCGFPAASRPAQRSPRSGRRGWSDSPGMVVNC